MTQFKGQAIEDDALLKQASLFAETGRPLEAKENLEQIIENHPESLLLDEAIFKLAMIYETPLGNIEKAMEMYQKIIFEHPSSIYLVASRKAFRRLRGDSL